MGLMRMGLPFIGLALGSVLFCGGFRAAVGSAAPAKLKLQMQRSSPQDLEISGVVPDIPAGASRFVRYSDLAALPQVSFTVKDDTNFDGPAQLSGVPLVALIAALGFSGGNQPLIAAICTDGYEGHYTAAYRAEHHPFLVLKMNGQMPAQWPKGPDGIPFAPYFISHAFFKPDYKILGHADEPQIPIGITQLRFYDQAAAFTPLKPPASAGAAAMQGYKIALQNCLRCHRAENIGGNKSPFQWPQLAMIAQGNAAAFGKYVVQPNRVNPEATMPANPTYDAPTVAALVAYFQSQGGKQ